MTALSQEILKSRQVRKTRMQKSDFIELLRRHFPDLWVEQTGGMKSRNLILGDPEQAKVVLTAHYDTCNVSLLPNLVMPYRKVLRLLYTMLALLPVIAISVAVFFLMLYLKVSRPVGVLVLMVTYYALFFGKTFLGRPNQHTANDNTSGVITLLEVYERLTPQQRQQVAIIFFDNEEYGCVGSGSYYKTHKQVMEEKLLLNFDCVSDGDIFLLVCSELAQRRYGDTLNQALPSDSRKTVVLDSRKNANHSSDHKHFPCSVAVSAMKESKWLGLYTDRIHTGKDTVFDKSNIDFLCNGVLRLVAQLCEQ